MKKIYALLSLAIPLVLMWAAFYYGYKLGVGNIEFHWWDYPFVITSGAIILAFTFWSLSIILEAYDDK